MSSEFGTTWTCSRKKEKQSSEECPIPAAQYYDSGIRKRSFQPGDMVLRELATSMLTKQGKLMPNWEGPYTVIEVIWPVTYKLAGPDGSPIKNTWHASRLRKYYQ